MQCVLPRSRCCPARPSQSLEGLIPAPCACVCIPNNRQTGPLWTLSAKEGKPKQYLKRVNPLTLREGALLEIKAFLLPVINVVWQQAPPLGHSTFLKDPTKLELAWLFPKQKRSKMLFSPQLSSTATSPIPFRFSLSYQNCQNKRTFPCSAQLRGAWCHLGCVHTNWAAISRVSLPHSFLGMKWREIKAETSPREMLRILW